MSFELQFNLSKPDIPKKKRLVSEEEETRLRRREISLTGTGERINIPPLMRIYHKSLCEQSYGVLGEALNAYWIRSQREDGVQDAKSREVFDDIYLGARYLGLEIDFSGERIEVKNGDDVVARHEKILGRELIDLEKNAAAVRFEVEGEAVYIQVETTLSQPKIVGEIETTGGPIAGRLKKALTIMMVQAQEFGSGTIDTPAVFSMKLPISSTELMARYGGPDGRLIDILNVEEAQRITRNLGINEQFRSRRQCRVFGGGYSSDMYNVYDGLKAQARTESPDGVLVVIGAGGAHQTHVKDGGRPTIAGEAGKMTQTQMSHQFENFVRHAGLGHFEELTIEGHSMNGSGVAKFAARYARVVDGIDIEEYKAALKKRAEVKFEATRERLHAESHLAKLDGKEKEILEGLPYELRMIQDDVDDQTIFNPEKADGVGDFEFVLGLQGIRQKMLEAAIGEVGEFEKLVAKLKANNQLIYTQIQFGEDEARELEQLLARMQTKVLELRILRTRRKLVLSEIDQKLSIVGEIRRRDEAAAELVTKADLWRRVYWDVDTPAISQDSVAGLIRGPGKVMHRMGSRFPFAGGLKRFMGLQWAKLDRVTPVRVLEKHTERVTDSAWVSTDNQLTGMQHDDELSVDEVKWLNKVPYLVVKLGIADITVFTNKIENVLLQTRASIPLAYYASAHFPMSMPGYVDQTSRWHDLRRVVANPTEWEQAMKVLRDLRDISSLASIDRSEFAVVGGLRHHPLFSNIRQDDQKKLMETFEKWVQVNRTKVENLQVGIEGVNDRYFVDVLRERGEMRAELIDAVERVVQGFPGAIAFAV